MDESTVESTDPQGQKADKMGRVAGVIGGGEEPAEEVLGGDGKPPDLVEAVPPSPTSSAPFSDVARPPSSDPGIETTNVDDPAASGDDGSHTTSGVEGASEPPGFAKQPKKRVKESDDESDGECEPTRKWRKKMVRESDGESSEDCALSRSAKASRKLKEGLRSGTLVIDEGKRERFEKKCRGLDGHAKFDYKGGWQVRHSKCSKWVKMQEPYNLVRFGEHIKGCKRMGEKGRNGTIDLFFKQRDPKGMKMTRIAQPSARKQIAAGANSKPLIKPDRPSIPFASSERPCLGLGEDQDERIGRYVSRVIVEGAGSHSDTRVTRMLFGDGVKYSELDAGSKRYVAAAQVHSQKWKISHTLRAVFSANCKGKVMVMNMAQSPVCDQCLGLLKLDVFKKALSVQPPPLENLKFTPHRHRSAATSLGINLAKIEGVSNLLEKVSRSNFCDPVIWDQHVPRTQSIQCGSSLPLALSTANTTMTECSLG